MALQDLKIFKKLYHMGNLRAKQVCGVFLVFLVAKKPVRQGLFPSAMSAKGGENLASGHNSGARRS